MSGKLVDTWNLHENGFVYLTVFWYYNCPLGYQRILSEQNFHERQRRQK